MCVLRHQLCDDSVIHQMRLSRAKQKCALAPGALSRETNYAAYASAAASGHYRLPTLNKSPTNVRGRIYMPFLVYIHCARLEVPYFFRSPRPHRVSLNSVSQVVDDFEMQMTPYPFENVGRSARTRALLYNLLIS